MLESNQLPHEPYSCDLPDDLITLRFCKYQNFVDRGGTAPPPIPCKGIVLAFITNDPNIINYIL